MDAEHLTLIRVKNRSILSDDYSTNSDTDDNDDDDAYSSKSSSSPPRTKKRITRIAIFGIVLIFLVLVYIPLSSNVQSRIVAIPGWNFNTSRETVDYVIPNANTTLIDPTHVCNGNKIFLLIVVCSSAGNFDARQTIRETWGNTSTFNYSYFQKLHSALKGLYLNIKYKNYDSRNSSHKNYLSNNLFNVKIVYLIGQTQNNETQISINQESDYFGDIVQESFLDSYNNLTLKSIMMLKWVTTNCVDKAKFVMKCDDDIFLNVPNLLHILLGGTVPIYNSTIGLYDQKTIKATSSENRISSFNKLLIGYLFCQAKPISDTSSKWYSPVYMFSGNMYPNYLSGTGYVMSMDSAVSLYNVSLSTQIFHLEDIFLTGICASKIKLRPHHNALFIYTKLHDLCSLRGMITQHQFTPDGIRKAYDFVTSTEVNCPGPNKYFNSRKIKPRRKSCQ